MAAAQAGATGSCPRTPATCAALAPHLRRMGAARMRPPLLRNASLRLSGAHGRCQRLAGMPGRLPLPGSSRAATPPVLCRPQGSEAKRMRSAFQQSAPAPAQKYKTRRAKQADQRRDGGGKEGRIGAHADQSSRATPDKQNKTPHAKARRVALTRPTNDVIPTQCLPTALLRDGFGRVRRCSHGARRTRQERCRLLGGWQRAWMVLGWGE